MSAENLNPNDRMPWEHSDFPLITGFNGLALPAVAMIREWSQPGYVVLEVGPGGGDALQTILHYRINAYGLEAGMQSKYAQDPQQAALKALYAQRGIKDRVIAGDAAHAAEACRAAHRGPFDVVVAFGTNWHNYAVDSELLAGFASLLKVTKPGGKLIVGATISRKAGALIPMYGEEYRRRQAAGEDQFDTFAGPLASVFRIGALCDSLEIQYTTKHPFLFPPGNITIINSGEDHLKLHQAIENRQYEDPQYWWQKGRR